jgi:hypothetical protein
MTRNSWRRTAFTSINGNVEIAPDDWTLLDPSSEPLARGSLRGCVGAIIVIARL